MKNKTILTCAVLAVTAFCNSAEAATVNTKPAVQAAKAWLALIDKGEYKQSWEQAASYFKSSLSADQWAAQVKSVREPLGAVSSRKVKSAKYATTLPGAPDGQYVVIQFDTSYAHKAHAVETVTPMKEKNGQWRVSGYFIR